MPIRLPFFAILLALLFGCETGPEFSVEGTYVPPRAGTVAVATIRGSLIKDSGFLEGDHLGFVMMIDAMFVRGSESNPMEPLALAPGRHSIVAKYLHSNFQTQAFLTFEAAAGDAYQLMIKNGTEAPDEQRYCEFWIADLTTGKSVSEVHHRRVSGGKTSSTFSAR